MLSGIVKLGGRLAEGAGPTLVMVPTRPFAGLDELDAVVRVPLLDDEEPACGAALTVAATANPSMILVNIPS